MFYRIPLCGRTRQKWIDAIEKVQPFENSTYYTICDLHFEDAAKVNIKEKIELRQGSAPSIFPSVSFSEVGAKNNLAHERSEADLEQTNNFMEYEESISASETIFEANIVEVQSNEMQELQPSGSIEQAFEM